MTVVNTNVAALSAQTSMMKNTKEMEGAMAKLASGHRINTAADDAAGLSISERLESQIAGLSQAIRNWITLRRQQICPIFSFLNKIPEPKRSTG